MDLDQIFHEIGQELMIAGGQFTAGYSPSSPDGKGRWEVRIQKADPEGLRNTQDVVASGETFLDALEKVIQQFRVSS